MADLSVPTHYADEANPEQFRIPPSIYHVRNEVFFVAFVKFLGSFLGIKLPKN
jgi:hypothetical protein